MIMIYLEIGEILEIEGIKFKCVEKNINCVTYRTSCVVDKRNHIHLKNLRCTDFACGRINKRQDNKEVIFIQIK